VGRGEFFGYLGPNGAGKTTSMKCMIGILKQDTGKIYLDGIDVMENPTEARKIIGFVPDSPFLYGKLSGLEFLHFIGELYSMNKPDIVKRIEWLSDIFNMHGWLERRTEEYSHGMKQKVVMSAAFLHNPRILIVDEPTVGLDPPSARLFKDMLKMMCKKGTTIFMSSHDLAVVEELCERMAILHKGRIAAIGTQNDLRKKASMEGGNLEDLFLKLTENFSRKISLE
jgi:ABC-2 type transport system ATP-binding protein